MFFNDKIVKSYEIYKFADPASIEEMLMFFRDEDRNMYKTTLATLAASRKLRPVFIQKKPVADQVKWMHSALRFKQNSDIGEHMLQVWFMKAKPEVLITACDGLGIEHNGEGYVEGDLPEKLDDKKLKSTVDTLSKEYGDPLTAIYLHIFNLQIPGGWQNLSDLLQSDKRVRYGDGSADAAPAPAAKREEKPKKATAKKKPAKKEEKEKKATPKKTEKKPAAKKAAKSTATKKKAAKKTTSKKKS